MLSLRECFVLAKKAYPRHYPYAFFEYGHYCYLHLCPKRRKVRIVQDEYHRIDRFTGKISGAVRVEEMLGDPELRALLEWECLVSDYEREHPGQYGRRGVLDGLARGINRLMFRPQGRKPGQKGENGITIRIRRDMEW